MSCLVLNTVYKRGNNGRVSLVEGVYKHIPSHITGGFFTFVEKTAYHLKGDTWFIYGTPVSDINFNQTKGLVEVTNPLVLESLWDIYLQEAREFIND